MSRFEALAGPELRSTGRRRVVRYLAALTSSAVAVLYFLIGFGAIYPVEQVPAGAPSLLFFGLPAGSAFVVGAVLLVATDRRRLWVIGAAFQVFAIVAYFQVAPNRNPPFEIWGILIKVLQLGILAALAYLVVHEPASRLGGRRAA